ncbi:hypothetical protein HH502_003986 [Escherichia coli]|nr:hypothetical protein [Escherichia coli]
MECQHRIFQTPAVFFFLLERLFVFILLFIFALRDRRVYSLCQQAGAKSS